MTEKFPHYWICAACAHERGGVWPAGHVATVVLKTCQYCQGKNHLSNEAIAPWVDYNWPSKKLTRIAKANRD